MKLALGFDHAGVKLKSALIEFLDDNGYEYKDFGTYTEDSCNYAEYGATVAEAVASGEYDRGILICGTGIGMSIWTMPRRSVIFSSRQRDARTLSSAVTLKK